MDSLLSALDNEPNLKYDKAGMIIVRYDGDMTRVLLLRGTKTGIWGFPKGQREERDSNYALRTAVRETAEETGLQPVADYKILSQRLRLGCRSIYWMAVAGHQVTPKISPSEHIAFGWFTPEEASALDVNMSVRTWLTKLSGSDTYVARLVRAAPQLVGSICPAAPKHSYAQACTSS